MEFTVEEGRFLSQPIIEWVVEGSFIKSHDGTVMLVEKCNPKNYVCYSEDGQLWNVRRIGQKPLPRDTPFDMTKVNEKRTAERQRNRDLVEKAVTSSLHMGAVVVFTDTRGKREWPGPHVVVSEPNAKARLRVAKHGGDNGRYVNCGVQHLKQVYFMGTDEFGEPVWA